MDQVPQGYKQAGTFMLISGIVHILMGGLTVLTGFGMCVGTYGLCCFCPAFGLIPIGIGAHEAMIGSQMQQGQWVANAKGTNLTGLIVGVMSFSMVGILLEALALTQLNQPDVVAYLEQGGNKLDWS